MTFKEKVYEQCCRHIMEKIGNLQQVLDDLKESIRNETKSTAGDKHETARAHLQIEQENTGRQLQEALTQKAVLDKIDIAAHAVTAVNGSLIHTGRGCFFMSTAIGKITCDGITVICLSQQSPLGAKLYGLKAGDSVMVNGAAYEIEDIQ